MGQPGEIAFKDFLLYLYQSATPSPSSTREGSVSKDHVAVKRGRATRNNIVLQQRTISKSLDRIRSESEMEAVAKAGVIVPSPRRNVSPVRNHGNGDGNKSVGIVIQRSQVSSKMSNRDKNDDKDDTSQRRYSVAKIPKAEDDPGHNKLDDKASVTNRSTIASSTRKKSLPTRSPHPPQVTDEPKNNKSSVASTSKNASSIRKKSLPSPPPQASTTVTTKNSPTPPSITPPIINNGTTKLPLKSKVRNQDKSPNERVSPSRRQSYIPPKEKVGSENKQELSFREMLGDSGLAPKPNHEITPSTKSSVSKKKSAKSPQLHFEEDTTTITRHVEQIVSNYEQDHNHHHQEGDRYDDDHTNNDQSNYLTVPYQNHPDLSFFKNFSATIPRTKESIHQELTLFRDSQQNHPQNQHYCTACLYNQYRNNVDHFRQHDEILGNLNKRHSRSSPIALDAVMTTKKINHHPTINFLPRVESLDIDDHHLDLLSDYGDNRKCETHSDHVVLSPTIDDHEAHPSLRKEKTHLRKKSVALSSSTPTLPPPEVNNVLSSSQHAGGRIDIISDTLSTLVLDAGGRGGEEDKSNYNSTSEEGDMMVMMMPQLNGGDDDDSGGGNSVDGRVEDDMITTTTTTLTVQVDKINALFVDTVHLNVKQDGGKGASRIKLYC